MQKITTLDRDDRTHGFYYAGWYKDGESIVLCADQYKDTIDGFSVYCINNDGLSDCLMDGDEATCRYTAMYLINRDIEQENIEEGLNEAIKERDAKIQLLLSRLPALPAIEDISFETTPVSSYHNQQFFEFINTCPYRELAYNLEEDRHNNEWVLDIISTSMSELEGSGDGILDTFTYNTEQEALDDLFTAEDLTNTSFDKV